MNKILVCLILFFNLVPKTWSSTNAHGQIPNKPLYQLVDLEVLESEKSYQEFFNHAKDVLPGSRNKAWQNMVKSMALGFMDKLGEEITTLSKSDYQLILEISDWATLREDEFFIRSRDLTLTKHYSHCFKTRPYTECYNEAKHFFSKYPTHDEFGYLLIKAAQEALEGKSIEQQLPLTTQYSLWPFVEKLVKRPISEFYCHKSPLFETIENRFFQLAYQDPAFRIQKHIHPDCWKVIAHKFTEKLVQNHDSYTRAIAFRILNQSVQFSKEDLYLYTMLQMLAGIPLDGEENLVFWERLKKLSKDPALREKILMRLQAYVPLPGETFLAATKQQKLVAKAMAQNFPEYIDHYARVCLEHMRGEKTTEGGNPATRCHELFTHAKALSLLPQAKRLEYSQLVSPWKKP